MDIDYYQTPEQQKLAFQRYSKMNFESLPNLFTIVNLYWGGKVRFSCRIESNDRFSFTFIVNSELLTMSLDAYNSDERITANRIFEGWMKNEICTVGDALDFILNGTTNLYEEGEPSNECQSKDVSRKKHTSPYDKKMVAKKISNKYFTKLIDFLYQVKIYSCPELSINIFPYVDTATFVFHFENYIEGYTKPLEASFEKTKASQEELEAYHNLFNEYMESDKKMSIQRALDILDPPDFNNEKVENSSLNDFEKLPWNIPAKYFNDSQEGKKYDNGKPMAGTLTDVFSRALMAVGACIEFGTHKYPDPKNWQLVDNGIKRYRDAMVRHLLKYNAGIDKDEETKLPHLAHMAWNALAILELYMQEHKDELDKEIFK